MGGPKSKVGDRQTVNLLAKLNSQNPSRQFLLNSAADVVCFTPTSRWVSAILIPIPKALLQPQWTIFCILP